MIYTPDFELVFGETKVPLLFNTWAFREYSRRLGIELEDLYQGIASGATFRTKNLPELLLVANLTYCKYNNKECQSTDLDACAWVDEMGGLTSPMILDVYKVFVQKLANLDPEKFEVATEKKEVVPEDEGSKKD